MAGMTNRFVKSPVAPKITSVHGGAAARRPALPDSAMVLYLNALWSCTRGLRPPTNRRAEAALQLPDGGRPSTTGRVIVPHLLSVPAELLAHRRQDLFGVGVLLARAEAGVERR